MTVYEMLRMVCYVVAAPTALYLAAFMARQRFYSQAVLYASLSLLFLWYMVEITIAATGVNTREYRVIGTPMVVSLTVALIWMCLNIVHVRRIWRREQ